MRTAGLMARWAAWQGGLMALVWGAWFSVLYALLTSGTGIFEWFQRGQFILLGVLVGIAGGRLLARHRRRVRFWGLAVALAYVAGCELAQTLVNQAYRQLGALYGGGALPAWWGYSAGIVWGVTLALFVALAQALVLWGRRWPREALFWFPGAVVVSIVGGAVATAFQALLPQDGPNMGEASFLFGLRMAGLGLCMGGIEGAGTAWLLDRCEFRRAPEEGAAG